MGEQEREMVQKATTMGEIIGVCLALRTLYNPKKMPRPRHSRSKMALGVASAQHNALADHAGIDLSDAASLDFHSSSGGRVHSRGDHVETRADAEDAKSILNRLKGGKENIHELRHCDFSPLRPKPGTKGNSPQGCISRRPLSA